VDPGLAITKQVTVVGGGAALPGGQLDYLVHVTNRATSPATTVVITDDISSAGAGRLTFVNPPAPTMNGSPAGVTVAGTVLTANYSAINGPLQPGQAIDVRFRVQIAAGIPAGHDSHEHCACNLEHPYTDVERERLDCDWRNLRTQSCTDKNGTGDDEPRAVRAVWS